MGQQLNYASSDQRSPQRAARFAVFVPVAALVVFILSLGVWSRKQTGWASRDFNIDVKQTRWGFPRWLVLNRMRATGNAPRFDPRYLPGAKDFTPGLHVNAPSLAMSLAGCVVAAVLLYLASPLLIPRRVSGEGQPRATSSAAWWWTLGLTSGSAATIGYFSEKAQGEIAFLLGFVVLPLLVCVAGFRVRSIRAAVLLAIAAGLSFWWAHRMARLLSRAGDNVELEEVAAMAVGILLLALAAAVSASFGRARTRSRPAAGAPQ
jgi:hypothetical protein